MTNGSLIKKVKKFALISFLLPLIVINSCLFLYKFLGDYDLYSGFDWDKERLVHNVNEHDSIENNKKLWTFTKCPKYKYKKYFITKEDHIILKSKENVELISLHLKNNEIKSIMKNRLNIINDRCVKNNKFIFQILSKFKALEKTLINTKIENSAGFVEIKNPYMYGEVSISRTARYIPANLIFKPFLFLTAIFLLFYWKDTVNLFSKFQNQKLINKYSKKFFYFGVLSAICLMIHAAFFGYKFNDGIWIDNVWYPTNEGGIGSYFDKLIGPIVLYFVIFEVIAQLLLTINLLKFRKEIKNYTYNFAINVKAIFVSLIVAITSIIFAFLIFSDMSRAFENALEWNYFSVLLFYYLISGLLWKTQKKPKSTHPKVYEP